jgi:hypothetical protein
LEGMIASLTVWLWIWQHDARAMFRQVIQPLVPEH